MIGKDSLVFDVTDAASIAASDSVGAYVRSSDGTLIDHASINSVDRLAVDATLKDGAGTALTSTLVGGKQALDVNIVEGINVEVDLSHLDDSVRLGDGTDFFTSTTIGSDVALDVFTINDPSVANTAIANAANTLAVADTAQNVVASPLSARKYLYIKNMDSQPIYIGATGVTAANGFPMSAASIAELKIGAAVDIEFVGSTGRTPEIRTMELS